MGNLKPWLWVVGIIIIIILLRIASAPSKDSVTGKIKCKDGTLVGFGHWFWYGCGANIFYGRTQNTQITQYIPVIVNPVNPIVEIPCDPNKSGYDMNGKFNPKCVIKNGTPCVVPGTRTQGTIIEGKCVANPRIQRA